MRGPAPGEGPKAPDGPVRTCVGCRRRRPVDSLVRLALDRSSGGTRVVTDAARRLPGRGAWLCADDPGCLAKARLKGRLARALRATDPDLSAL